VIIYVHGGGYEGGSGSGYSPLDWYGAGIDDVVFVSMNYRLGIFGFLGSAELQARTAAIDCVSPRRSLCLIIQSMWVTVDGGG
jgi:carboxylesterase type B